MPSLSTIAWWRLMIVGSLAMWLVFGWLVILAICEFLKLLGYVT